MKAAFALIATAALSGCAVPLSADVAEQQNTCSSDADCGRGGACVDARGGKICAATDVTLSGLKLVITPIAGANTVTTTPTVLDPAAQHVTLAKSDTSGYSERFDVTVPGLAQVDFATLYTCQGKLVEVPSKMVLANVVTTPGLPVSMFFTTTDPNDPNRQIASIPAAGLYSAYVVPGASAMCDAPPPSIFTICLQDDCPPHSTRPGRLTSLDLSKDLILTGAITSKISLAKWTLDLIDLDGARILSDEYVFKPQIGVPTTQFSFDGLHFNWPDKDKSPTIRLTPPPGSSAPTMYWELAPALGASTDYDVKLTIGDFTNETQETQVFVLDNEGKKAQPKASVTFQSTDISNLDCAGLVSKTVEADDLGRATVELPVGRYLVRATPRNAGGPLSIGETTLTVAKLDTKLSAGHSILLPKKAELKGSVSTAQHQALGDVPVSVAPSQVAQSYDLVSLTTNQAWSARPFTTTTGSDGSFSLKVDIGAPLDVSIRPADGSGYPWLVQPELLLQKGGAVDTSLKGSTLPWPALLQGRIANPDGSAVANAAVAAYLPLDVGEDTPVVVEIGETTTDADGNYELVLPASISSGK